MKIPKSAYFIIAVLAGACWGTHGTFASLLGQYGVSDDVVSFLCPLFYGSFFFYRSLSFKLKFIIENIILFLPIF